LSLRTLAKLALLKVGSHSSEKAIHHLNGMLDYVELGWWLRERGFSGGLRLCSCFDIPRIIAADIGERPVLYLQFGAEDAGMVGRWASALHHPETRLHVFDLADRRSGAWLPARGRGHLWESTGRVGVAGVPATHCVAHEDPRIGLFSGNLQDLLAAYDWPHPEIVVAALDTDLYSTTKAALDFIGERLPSQVYLFFDQLNHRADELRAFHEFLLESGTAFELFAGNRVLSCVVFRSWSVAAGSSRFPGSGR
jgi:hypothetical protein